MVVFLGAPCGPGYPLLWGPNPIPLLSLAQSLPTPIRVTHANFFSARLGFGILAILLDVFLPDDQGEEAIFAL